ASRHARAAARIVVGGMGIAVLIALAITVVGLGMRAEQERSAESVTPQATSTTAPPAAEEPAAPQPLLLLVETFTTSEDDAELDELAVALSDAAAEALKPLLPGMRLMRRQADSSATSSGTTAVGTTPEAALPMIFLRGALKRNEQRLAVDVSMTHGNDDRVLVQFRVERPATAVFDLQAELGRELRRGLREARAAVTP
ncbi:MAG: hypothetical protein ACO3JL_14990, partial [Myxococcota bacterium]